MTEQELQDALLAYLARDDSDEPEFQSLTTIYEKLPEAKNIAYELDEVDRDIDQKELVHASLDRLVADGTVESQLGERDYKASYRISKAGFYEAVLGTDKLFASNGAGPQALIDSTKWTGSRLAHVDSVVLAKIRSTALQLQAVSRKANFETEGDAQDIRGLADALVSLCDMAEPELDLIDRVTSHPKFKKYAAFFVFLATIRGALGL